MHAIKYKSKAEKQVIIQDFLSSGKSKKIWCEETGISYSTFYKWMKTYNSDQTTVKFVPLKQNKNSVKDQTKSNSIPVNNSTSVLLEIGTCKIHVSELISMSFLTDLMKVVKSLNV